MNNRKNSLKYLVNEVISEKKITRRFNYANNVYVSLNETAIFSLLKSNVFTLNEQKALKVLFLKTKTKSLTENTVKILDENVKTISSSSEIELRLKEGFFGDIWDGLKAMGDKAKEAIVGGWNKIKAIWSEFKQLVQEVINSAKNGLLKLCGKIRISAEADAKKMLKDVMAKSPIKFDDDLRKEFSQLKETSGYWINDWYQTWVIKPFWEKNVLKGNGTVDEEPDVDNKEAQASLEKIPALENLISKRNSLLSNYEVVNELLKRHENRNFLKEAHTVEHLDDAIKNPALRKIVHYAVELIQWAFIPFAKLGQIVGKWIGPKVLSSFSNATKVFGGPGVYAFELMGALFGEFLEVVIKTYSAKYATGIVKDIMFPGFGLSENIVHGIHLALLCWTYANILINLVDAAEKEGGKSTSETYKPIGRFKIKEGNLLYINK